MDQNWDLFRSFLAVLRTGSLTAAAKSLTLTQPTLGRHIRELENSLGPLFVRSQDGLRPTELGERLRARAGVLEMDVAALVREATYESGGVSGVVRVTAGETFACEWLPPIFESIQKDHPKLKIELVVSNKVDNLVKREADIAIRLVRPVQNVLLFKKAGEVEVGLHAHKKYLADRGTPKSVADLQSHAVIGYDTESDFVRAILNRAGELPSREEFSYRTDSDLANLALLRAGCGIGFCHAKIAARDKNLVRLLPTSFSFRLGIWVAMHEDLKSRPATYAVFQGLISGFAAALR